MSVVDYLRSAAEEHPEALALVWWSPEDEVGRTYAQIWWSVRRLAARLRKCSKRVPGRQSPVVVAVAVDGEAMPIAMLAVLTAGMTMLPVLPSDPRKAQVFADTRPVAVITDSSDFKGLGVKIVNPSDGDDDDLVDARPTEDMVSHIYTTSGSTGRPKGVAVTHKSLLAYCLAKNARHEFGVGDRAFIASSLSFDPSLGDICAAVVGRGVIALAPRDLIMENLPEMVERTSSTHCCTTPVVWGGVDPPSCLRVLALGGEKSAQDFIDRVASKVALLNTYGVTEATVYQTTHRFTPGDDPGLIGEALDGVTVFLADPDGSSWEDRKEGEVCIAGGQVGVGYVKAAELTAAAFVSHPKHGRVYRTGDLARRMDDGRLLLIGRKDHQVKVRGVRLELGEVEAGVMRTGAVGACCAFVNDGCLVACVTTRDSIEVTLFKDVLRHLTNKELPAHMVPHQIIVLETLPLSATGKVDREALRQLSLDPPVDPEPLTAVEEQIASVWAAELGVAVGKDGHFLELGGDSLTALRVGRRLAMLHQDESNAQDPFGALPERFAPVTILNRPQLVEYAAYLCGEESKESAGSMLYRVSAAGASTLTTRLLSAKANIESEECNGKVYSPLHIATTNGHSEVVSTLLEYRAKPNLRDHQGLTALHVAVQFATPVIVNRLLQAKAMLTARDDNEQTVLHHMARVGAGKDVVELLLQRWQTDPIVKTSKAIWDWKDSWKRTPIHWAVLTGQRAIIVRLLEIGASAKPAGGETPLEMADRLAKCGVAASTLRVAGSRASLWGDIASLLRRAGG